MHSPSTHRSSNSGHGERCDVDAFTFSLSSWYFAVEFFFVADFSVDVVIVVGCCVVVVDVVVVVVIGCCCCDLKMFLISVVRKRFGSLTVVVVAVETAVIVTFGLTKIGLTPSPVDTILSPSESLWLASVAESSSSNSTSSPLASP